MKLLIRTRPLIDLWKAAFPFENIISKVIHMKYIPLKNKLKQLLNRSMLFIQWWETLMYPKSFVSWNRLHLNVKKKEMQYDCRGKKAGTKMWTMTFNTCGFPFIKKNMIFIGKQFPNSCLLRLLMISQYNRIHH